MAKILVVDDSAVDRQLVCGLLGKQSGWTIETAINGAEALERVAAWLPDLVVTDLQMPVMNGLELVSEMKSRHPQVPVILMTSQGSEELAMQALQAGAASYTPKRRLAEDLLMTSQNVLALSQQQRNQARLLGCMTANAMSFRLDNDSSLVPPLITLIQERVVHLGINDQSEQIRLGIALEEALVNAMIHGNLEISSELREREDNAYYKLAEQRRHEMPYSQRQVTVDASYSHTEVIFVVRDQGPGFDPATLPDPRDPENLERVYGRGLLLIRNFMDDVFHNKVGNEITMVKRRNGAANGREQHD